MTVVHLQMLPLYDTGNYLAAISVLVFTSGNEWGAGRCDCKNSVNIVVYKLYIKSNYKNKLTLHVNKKSFVNITGVKTIVLDI